MLDPSRTLRRICETGLPEQDFRVTSEANLLEALDHIDVLDLDAVVTQMDVDSDTGRELVALERFPFELNRKDSQIRCDVIHHGG